jgi:hypothetical protein
LQNTGEINVSGITRLFLGPGPLDRQRRKRVSNKSPESLLKKGLTEKEKLICFREEKA